MKTFWSIVLVPLFGIVCVLLGQVSGFLPPNTTLGLLAHLGMGIFSGWIGIEIGLLMQENGRHQLIKEIESSGFRIAIIEQELIRTSPGTTIN